MTENAGSDKSWVFNTFDFADGELAENTFAIRFKTAEQAQEFKAAYEGAAAENDAGADSKPAAADDDSIPVVDDIKALYGEGPLFEKMCDRYAECATKFEATYQAPPEFFVRAPGRVNLIGEHIDYMGYSVLPMAIANDILIAGRIVEAAEGVQVHNVKESFSPKTLEADPAAEVAAEEHHWSRYFHCGYKGVFDASEGEAMPVGMQVMVSGTVPTGAGLSSSSAFVVASFLATATANGKTFTRTQAAEACRACEQYVGTMGGGMDQAISCLGVAGQAKHIEFNPLSASTVALPEGGTFVIANSLTPSEKAVTASKYFNKRVVECKIAAALLGKGLGLEGWQGMSTLKAVQEAAGKSTAEMVEYVAANLQEEPYTTAALTEELGSLSELLQSDKRADAVLAEATEFLLRDRATHVYGEAQRVASFAASCAEEGEADAKLVALGELMTASHSSCRDQYQCSCDELDALTSAALAAGALGSRLTGAGWGGCTVSLVRDDNVEAFIQQVTENFYSGNPNATEDVSNYIFASKPCTGCAVYKH